VYRVLVTGARGFVGRALCRSLVSLGHEVLELSRADGDISNPATLKSIGPAEHVFHLAARTFVPDSWNDPRGFHVTNVLGTLSVLEYCRHHRARLTFVSAYVYGSTDRLPITEDVEPQPRNPYALSKHMAEQACRFFSACHDIDVIVPRPFNLFGPGQDKHFLIPHILHQVEKGESIHVQDLSPKRDYLYIDDFIEFLIRTLEGPAGYNIFNVGSGISLSVEQVISVVQSVAGTTLPVTSAGEVRRNEIDDVYANVHKARALLGWTCRTAFRDGIERILCKK
jgi:nucleoside-diphosphate-sugar epimerase